MQTPLPPSLRPLAGLGRIHPESLLRKICLSLTTQQHKWLMPVARKYLYYTRCGIGSFPIFLGTWAPPKSLFKRKHVEDNANISMTYSSKAWVPAMGLANQMGYTSGVTRQYKNACWTHWEEHCASPWAQYLICNCNNVYLTLRYTYVGPIFLTGLIVGIILAKYEVTRQHDRCPCHRCR
jgi:hypothetical protein